jgi:hypothetical protein
MERSATLFGFFAMIGCWNPVVCGGWLTVEVVGEVGAAIAQVYYCLGRVTGYQSSIFFR